MNPCLPLVLLGCLALPALLPASLVTDRRMETAVRSSYVYRVVLQDRVRANAEFGVLTLTGSVEDEADRLLAEDTARGVAWVSDVTNRITLLPSHREQSDPWLAQRVVARLRQRTDVSADAIHVAVVDGKVTLSGTARDDLQKERTALIAAGIPGVRQVQNNLVLKPAPAGEVPLPELVDDASIRGLIIGALRQQGLDVAAAVKVSVVEGAVRLTGEVADEMAKEAATRLAREAHGTRFVTNMLKCGHDPALRRPCPEPRHSLMQKTKKSVAKRFKLTATGKLLRRTPGFRHLLAAKSTKAKRRASKDKLVAPGHAAALKRCLPFGL